MPDYKILIADGLHEIGQKALAAVAQTDDRNGISAAELLQAIPSYDAVITRSRTQVTRAVIEAGPRLKVIGRAGVGVDNIDLVAARQRGLTVVNAPVSTALAVAELTFGLLLALAREIPRADAALKAGGWPKADMTGLELHGKTLGIIGIGRIGEELSRRAVAFGMNVIAYDPLVEEAEIRGRAAEPVSIQDLYAWSDFISLHLPRDVHTRDMLGRSAFSQMKAGVRIVCAARGGIIEEPALLEALNSGQVAGAALDVFASEPPGATELVRHPRVIATPHIGAQTAEAQLRAAQDIAAEVAAALRGNPLRWRVA
jgi:D-3-phosphoglycerate dehydrogenase